jgi:indole-3-pyruvate monooxygenase
VIDTATVIIGAGPAGLSVAGCLRRAGLPFELVERADSVGAAWRGHYDRLHLHTDKSHSELPHHPYPRDYPKYPARDQVVAYLESYPAALGFTPRLGETVERATREGDAWEITTSREAYRARHVIVATGYTQVPEVPDIEGRATYTGEILHSSAFRTGAAYQGRSALVVGFGNSGGEIAIDLAEHGARTELSVRSAVNVIKRDILGVPILSIAGLFRWLPPRLADALSWPLTRLSVGNLRKLGLRQLPFGPMQQITRTQRIPLIDIGTLALIRKGAITVRPGIARLDRDEVVFADDTRGRFDVIILATGYRPGVAAFLDANGVLDEQARPTCSGRRTAQPGLYFCGFHVSPFGMLRAIADEARAIAADISSRSAELPPA